MGVRQRLLGTTAPFARGEDGNVATWFGLMVVPMMGLTFGAIEYAELVEQRASMTDAMDAAALGIARQYEILDIEACDIEEADSADSADPDAENKRRLERFGREFFAENYPEFTQLYADADLSRSLDLEQDLEFELTCEDITVKTTAYTDMGGILAERFGVGAIPLELETNITLFQQSKMEIALVLDVTGSMGWGPAPGAGPVNPPNRRIDKLAEAVQGMLDHEKIFGEDEENERVKFSIVPFNTFVNVGAGYNATVSTRTDDVSDWMDGAVKGSTAKAFYHGAHFFHAYENLLVDHPHPAGPIVTGKASADIRVSDRKVNHFDLFRSVGDDGTAWKGCVEARPFPLDEIPHRPGTALSETEYTRVFSKPSGAASGKAGVNSVIDAAWSALGNKPTAQQLGYDPKSTDHSRFVPAFTADGPECDGDFWNDCYFWNHGGWDNPEGALSHDTDPAANPPAHRDLTGRGWHWDWDVEYRPAAPGQSAGWFYVWQQGPVPRHLFSRQGNNMPNQGFIKDNTFLSLKKDTNGNYVAAQNDKHRYRNLMYKVYQHGLNHATPSKKWPTQDTSSWTEGSKYDEDALANRSIYDRKPYCRAPNTTYVYDANIRNTMDRFRVEHCEDEQRLRRAYVGVYNDSRDLYYGKYENLAGSAWSGSDNPSSHGTTGVGPNVGCAGPILPLTNEKDDIETVLDALVPSGGTNTAIGLSWGWRTLTHEAPFIEAANPQTGKGRNWYKIAILLTDGDNSDYTGSESSYTAFGRGSEDRVRAAQAGISFAKAVDYKTIRMCHRMRAEGIKVYTIGFAISQGSNADKMLAACAVDDDAYFLAENASDLNDAFEEIADQITELHISG